MSSLKQSDPDQQSDSTGLRSNNATKPDRILIVNERHLRQVLTTYLHHFNEARPHRALAQLTPTQTETPPPHVINLVNHQVHRRLILDGLTSEYQIAA